MQAPGNRRDGCVRENSPPIETSLPRSGIRLPAPDGSADLLCVKIAFLLASLLLATACVRGTTERERVRTSLPILVWDLDPTSADLDQAERYVAQASPTPLARQIDEEIAELRSRVDAIGLELRKVESCPAPGAKLRELGEGELRELREQAARLRRAAAGLP